MSPRAAKKGPGGAAKKAPAKSAKVAPKPEVVAEEVVKVEPAPAAAAAPVVKVTKETKVEEVVVVEEKETTATNATDNGDTDTAKVTYEEEDQDERLDLEDEPEYEPEEVVAVDYSENEMEDEVQEGDGGEEEGEEEGDIVDVEDAGDDEQGEEDDENVGNEREADAEEEEHHDVVKERRKRKEFEVFVGGLDKESTEEDLKKVFSAVGEITEVRLMMNPLTKKNKGFAFLRFATIEQAKRAVSELKSPMINGKQCGVAPSQDSDTLFLGNICKTWTKEHLKEKLKTYGIESIEDLTLVEDTNNEGMNRGFAFLEFSSRSEAMDAFRRLQKRDVLLGVERNAKVAFADSFIEPDDEIMAQVKTIFIDGLPAAWDEEHVKECVKKFGEIEKIELARNMPAAKRKDFGFVTFGTHDAAVACAEGINNVELGEGDSKIKVRARLSRPLQRGRSKRGARVDFRMGRGALRGGRLSWSRPAPYRFPSRGSRFGSRGPPLGARVPKRPIAFRDRRPVIAVPERARRLPPPERFYERRPPVPAYPKGSSKRDYRREELAPRRAAPDYASRVPSDRRQSYREDYSSRTSGYSDVFPRGASRGSDRKAYVDDTYSRKVERPPAAYREGRSRDYDAVAGSKRHYSTIDDAPPRYADVSVRQSRPRLDYGVSGSDSQYDDAYGERIGRSHAGYGGSAGSRSSLSGHDSHGLYTSRQGMSYGGGSVGGSDVGGVYSSSFSSGYLSRGSDVGGSSYSSLYSGRNLGSGGYLGGNGSSSYY